MEDYLEVIYELIQQKGYATTLDISKYLNVSSPSVTKMVQRLCETGYLNYEKYRGLSLTQKGTSVAIDIHNRHSLLTEFLKMIGVDEDVANRDAEGRASFAFRNIKEIGRLCQINKEENSKFVTSIL